VLHAFGSGVPRSFELRRCAAQSAVVSTIVNSSDKASSSERRLAGARLAMMRRSFSICASTARSISARPAGVSCTSRLRASLGLARRSIQPAASSRCRRWVMVPEVIISAENSAVGARQCGAPERRRVASTSNSQLVISKVAKVLSSRRCNKAAQRLTRPMAPIGLASRSGRSRRHCSRIASTESGGRLLLAMMASRFILTSRQAVFRLGSYLELKIVS
jgi:hypothetical protein